MKISEFRTFSFLSNLRYYAVFVITIGLWAIINFSEVPFCVHDILKIAPGVVLLDMRFGYSQYDVVSTLAALGPAGRYAYVRFLSFYDYGFALCYALFFSLSIRRLLFVVFPNKKNLAVFGWLPLVGGACDWIENCWILVFLNKNSASASMAMISSLFTECKWIISASSIVVIVVLLFIFVFQTARKQAKGGS